MGPASAKRRQERGARVGQPHVLEKEGALNLINPRSEPVLGLRTKV